MSENKFSIGDTLIVTVRSTKCRGFVGDVESIIDRSVLSGSGCKICKGRIMYQLSFNHSIAFCECVLRKKNDSDGTSEKFKDLIDSLNRDKIKS